MNPHLLNILRLVTENQQLSEFEKKEIETAIKEADRLEQLNQFKIDRAADDRRTLSIMLEESLEDLEHKRKAVEEKNRDLEIEAALERVRTVAMSMNKPEDLLNISRALFAELSALHFSEMRNTMIQTYFDEKRYFDDYDYSDFAGGHINSIPYKQNSIVDKFLNEFRQSKDAFSEIAITGDDMERWIKFRDSNNETPDERLYHTPSLYYYFYSVGGAAIGISTFHPIPPGELEIVKRFRNVFDLAYQRYVDISNALAQAHEARIQTALERVRAAVMAMKKTDEAVAICEVMYNELLSLGIGTIRNAQIAEKNESMQAYLLSAYSPEGSISQLAASYNAPITKALYDELGQSRETFYEREFSGESIEEWRRWRESLAPLTNPRERDAVSLCFYLFSFGDGHIGISTYEIIPQEQIDLLKRFKKVFELGYTRFTDVKRAEAQAREAQVELGLERVRAKAMAMQTSEELSGLVATVITELSKLDLALSWCLITLLDEASWSARVWRANSQGDQEPQSYDLPFADHPFQKAIMQAWRERQEKWSYVVKGEEKKSLEDYMFTETDYRKLPAPVQAGIRSADPAYFYFSFGNFGGLQVGGPKQLSNESVDILARFGRVFDATYTRFNDLKQAEAQAREAKIQLALERVRARTMAMQHSSELGDVATVLFNELRRLGGNLLTCGIALCEKNNPIDEFWLYTEQGIQPPFCVPHTEDDAHMGMYDGWETGADFFAIEKGGDELKAHYNYMLSLDAVGPIFERMLAEGFTFPTWQKWNAAYFKQGFLMVITVEPYNGEVILKRFAAVFQQTYTRFLDLKQAEAQAREGQIQLALERVRASTMAMQHSGELSETVFILFQQFKELGENPDQATIGIVNEEEGVIEYRVTMLGNQDNKLYKFPIDEPIVTRKIYEAWKKQKKSLVIDLSGKELLDFMHFRAGQGGAPVNKDEKRRIINVAFFSKGLLNVQSTVERSEASIQLLERFAAVFDLTYTRFLDLKKAEAQALEARIEAALEKVRSRSLAMFKTEDVGEVVNLVFEKMRELGVNTESDAASIMLFEEGSRDFVQWIAIPGQVNVESFRIGYIDHPIPNEFFDARESGADFFAKSFPFEVKNPYWSRVMQESDFKKLPDELKQVVLQGEGYSYSVAMGKYSGVCVPNFNGRLLSEPENDILKRFARVFEQAYIRFLDIRKAEEQAREAQIENALEKVRSRSLAMHNSDELREVVTVVFEKLKELGLPFDSAVIIEFMENANDMIHWVANDKNIYSHPLFVPYAACTEVGFWSDMVETWRSGKDSFAKVYSFEEKNAGFKKVFENTDYKHTPEDRKKFILESPVFGTSVAIAKHSAVSLTSFSGHALTEPEFALLKRMGRVFEQAYVRFLDLKKAEAQAREAQIEVALERVRSKAMAMHKSQDIDAAVLTVFEELEKLDLDILRCGIGIIDKENKVGDVWTTAKMDGKSSIQISGKEPMWIHPLLQGTFDAWLKQTDFLYELEGDDLVAYYRAVSGTNFTLPESHSLTDENHGAEQYYYTPTFKTGNLYAFKDSPFPEEAKSIMKRFASVLNLTFSRFLDLQKAEAQARDAQIEASLERVRSKAMSMRDSNGLLEAASTVFIELQHLGINQIRSGVGLITKDFHKAKVYSATSSQNAIDLSLMGEVTLYGHPVFEQQYQSWLKRENYFVALEGKELASYYKILSAGLNANLGITVKKNQKEYGHWFMFSEGFLYAWSDKEYTDSEIRILERFKNVMELTIRRYIELQKSETQAREAVRQASLDRVRAEIASMRSISDLDRITPLIWNELTILGVPFIRCGVFIMDEQQQLIHTYLSTPDGKAIAAFQLPFSSDSGNRVNGTALRGWREKQAVTLHWTEEEFRNFSHSLMEQGEITSEENYLTGHLPTGLDLHFFPFLQGMLYAGNTAPLSDDEKDLVQSLADAFSTAYARYEDFNRLETAKQEVERTLTDLRTAQTRLIQSEKMASLGELTAGIAHEIQNPLNFVNNFSEVNKEMLEELKAESEKPKAERDEQLEIELINDLIKNEEKINHHGKRADGIVKGMLQHSRTAGGEKTPTNINSVAEEYMGLSYHGLRAKDKSFNAEMIMNFDPDLPRIQAVGQDIGRVFLNLFNNAFYAVNQKSKTAGPDYMPTVTVETFFLPLQGVGGFKVKDNGVGIPDVIKEKIMQPFFTTKPTGEGTGLGLSLTYDMVVKGHEGTIKVDSKEGEFTEFTITLPL